MSQKSSAQKEDNRFLYVAALISALGGMLFGYDTGVISGAILFIKGQFALSSTMEELVVSSVLVGAVVGVAFGGTLADNIGRRKVIILAAVIFILGSIIAALAQAIAWLVAGRVVVGIAIGLASFTSPLYISEVSPASRRGSLVSLNQLAITVGIVLSYLVDFALAGIQGWRWMFGLAIIPAAILGMGMFFMPDSPRWLMKHDESDKARDVLRRIRGYSNVDGEMKEIQESLGKQSSHWSELFNPLVKPAMAIGISLAIFQQVTGINTVIYYAPTIFQFAGFKSASSAILATMGVGIVNVLMTAVAIGLIDRVGRRPLLLTGLIGMAIGLGLLGFAFMLPGQQSILGLIAAGSLMLYVASFAIGLGPVFWLLISEIYPLKIRGLAMSVATEANWGSNLIIALTFLTLIQLLGETGTFWLYGLVSIMAWLFAYFRVPETKGRSLEEIEAHWRAGKHPREMGKVGSHDPPLK
jgi:SP family galactose:H+ symporter-like MFS transporter